MTEQPESLDYDAFPTPADAHPGMTLRDWFAGKAIASEPQSWSYDYSGKLDLEYINKKAAAAYALADAMLRARR